MRDQQNLPEQNERKVILVLDYFNYDKFIESDDTRAIRLDESILALAYPVSRNIENEDVIQMLSRRNQLKPGAILIQNPFLPDEYEPVSVAQGNIAMAKHFYFSQTCMYLGACSVKVLDRMGEELNASKKGKASAGHAVASGEIEAQSKSGRKSANSMSLEDTFAANNEPDFVMAKKVLQDTGLWWTDRTLRNLYEIREQGGDKLVSRKLSLNLAQEVNQSLEICASLDVIGTIGKIGMKAQYNSDVTKIENKEYVFEVQFAN